MFVSVNSYLLHVSLDKVLYSKMCLICGTLCFVTAIQMSKSDYILEELLNHINNCYDVIVTTYRPFTFEKK